MAHSSVAFHQAVWIIRDDLLLRLVETIAKETQAAWLTAAAREWVEHCVVMPPGAKRIDFAPVLTDMEHQRQFVRALAAAESSFLPAELAVMPVAELRAHIGRSWAQPSLPGDVPASAAAPLRPGRA